MTVPRRTLLAAVVAVLALALPASAFAAAPTLSGSYSDSANIGGATSVAIAGHYAYTTTYYAGVLAAINISNPASPTLAGISASAPSLTNGSTVNIVGGYAYVVSKNRNRLCMPGPVPACSPYAFANDDGTGNSLTILDIHTNPSVPRIVGSMTDALHLFGAYGVAVSGDHAYVAAQGCAPGQPCPNPSAGNAFDVVDLSNPAAPTLVASLHNSNLPTPFTNSNALAHADSVYVSGSDAYVTASNSNELTIIDISNPLSPAVVSVLRDNVNLASADDVAVQGNYAYVTNQTTNPAHASLAVVDVSNPASPRVVGSVINSAPMMGAYRIRVRGDFAYVAADAASSVAIVDISNPASPRLAGVEADGARLNHTTGLDVDPSGQYVVASSPFLFSEVQPGYPPFPPAPGAPTLTGTVSAITLDPSPIAITIARSSEPPNPTAQTSATFSFSVNDAVSAVQCRLDSVPLGLCTSPTTQRYGKLAPGSHTFTVQAVDAAGRTATATYVWTVSGKAGPGKAGPGKVRPRKAGPNASGASLTGIAKRKAKLVFTIRSAKQAPLIKSLVIGLPRGLSYTRSKKRLAAGIVVKRPGGKRLKLTAKVSRGALTITLRTATASAQATIEGPAVAVTKRLAGEVKAHKVKSLVVIVKATDVSHKTTRLSLRIRPR